MLASGIKKFSNSEISNYLQNIVKPPAFSGKPFPLNELTDRDFEILLFQLFQGRVNKNFYQGQFDEVHLMPGVGEQGRDVLLTMHGKNTGLVQCKKINGRIDKPTVCKEILKFALNALVTPGLIDNVNSFTYYLAASTGFSQPTIALMINFNQEIIKETELQKWTEGIIRKFITFNHLKYAEIEINLKNILQSIKVERITPEEHLQLWLYENESIVSMFFMVRTVTDSSEIVKVAADIKEVKGNQGLILAKIEKQTKSANAQSEVPNNLKEAAQYKALLASKTRLEEQIRKTKLKIIQYPSDKDFKEDIVQFSKELNEIEQAIEELKKLVYNLTSDFNRIPNNWERLSRAKHHFEAGEFAEARKVLDTKKMSKELDEVSIEEELGRQFLTKAKEKKARLSYEYLIKAQLTEINFELPERFTYTKEYFEASLRAERNIDNLYAFGSFLHIHNQIIEAISIYEEIIVIGKSLVASDLRLYLTKIAFTYANLAGLYRRQKQFDRAEQVYGDALEIFVSLGDLAGIAGVQQNLGELFREQNLFSKAEEFYQEAFKINKDLAKEDPCTHLPSVAETLYCWGIVHRKKGELFKSELAYRKALRIYKSFVKKDIGSHLLDLSKVLNNLGVLQKDKREYDIAANNYQEALRIRRDLAQSNAYAFLPFVADTLDNIGGLQIAQEKWDLAEENIQEGLSIRRSLALANPMTYLDSVSVSLNNLVVVKMGKREFSLVEDFLTEALDIKRNLAQKNPKAFLLSLALTATMSCELYSFRIANKERSLSYAREALKAIIDFEVNILGKMPFKDFLPESDNLIKIIINVFRKWGEDPLLFLNEIYYCSR